MVYLIFALLLAQDKAIVEGIVMNALTNEPLRKASVSLDAGNKTYAVVSSSGGKFRFEEVEPGHYDLRVERPGFLDDYDEPGLVISSGQPVKGLAIKLTPQGVIAGHVVDEDGDPVPGADVIVDRSLQVSGHKVRLYSSSERTNSEGYFLVSGLKAGRYRLSAAPPDNNEPLDRPPNSPPREDFVHTDYPLPIQLAPGQESRNIEIRLQKAAVFRVRGRVPNRPNDTVSLNLSSETEGYTSGLHGDGTFTFETVAAGTYELTVSNWSTSRTDGRPRPATLFCHVPVTVSDRDVDGVVAELVPGPTIEGTIRMEGDDHFEKPPTLQLMGTFPPKGVTANEDGTFSWTNLLPKKYLVDYGPPEGFYVKSIQFNHQPMDGMWVDLNAGAGGILEIAVAPHAATVSATVEGGKKAHVILWSDSQRLSSETADDGTVTFSHLAPGEYWMQAWDKVDWQLTQIPEFQARFDARKITLAEGSHETFQVKLIPRSASDAEIAKLQ